MTNNGDIGFLSINHNSRMADVLCRDFSIIPLFYNFGIGLGFGDATVDEVCRKHSIPSELFLTMCRAYVLPGYMPDCSMFGEDDLKVVAQYIHQSHLYYIEEVLPELDRHLEEVVACYDDTHKKVLSRFYSDYRKEVDKHFDYEERIVIPYLRDLLEGKRDGRYSIADFEDNHSDIEGNLDDLRNIIIKYLPGQASIKTRYGLLSDIVKFGNELDRHTFIENKILVPIALKIEKHGK